MERQTLGWAEVFVCPQCKGSLAAEAETLRCAACRLAYPVVDGVPVLLIEEAVPLASGEVST